MDRVSSIGTAYIDTTVAELTMRHTAPPPGDTVETFTERPEYKGLFIDMTVEQMDDLLRGKSGRDLARMAKDPGLELESRWAVFELMAHRQAAGRDSGLNELLPSMNAEDVDELVGNYGPAELERAINLPGLDPAARAKLVDVALRRGGTRSRAQMEALNVRHVNGERPYDDELAYQKLAIDTVFHGRDGAAVFDALSRSPNVLSKGESPATRLMYVAGQSGGWRTHRQIGEWIGSVPPYTRGAAMAVIFDASGMAGQPVKVSGFSVGAGGLSVTFDIEDGDRVWHRVVEEAGAKFAESFDGASREDVDAAIRGYRRARGGLEAL